MLGKIRVRHAPWTNHGWHVALQPNARGLATLPTAAGDGRTFTLALDLCRHAIVLTTSGGEREELSLDQQSIAALHSGLVEMLRQPWTAVGFQRQAERDPGRRCRSPRTKRPARTIPNSATRFREALAAMLPVFERFRAGFTGKSSPVHFWWGSFDLAVTRFSGRTAPTHPGGVPGLPDNVTREAYSQEVSSAGFWAGGVTQAAPFFYSYSYPEPAGFRDRQIAAGSWNADWQEFTLSYDEVRTATDPEAVLTSFLQSTYDAAADLAEWDRVKLEREPVAP